MAVKTSTLVGKEIEDLGKGPVVVVTIVRNRRQDMHEVGSFLVDTECLGVKDAWFEVFRDGDSFDEMLGEMFVDGYLEKSGAWGRGFVEAAVKYARSLGFAPHRDYKKAARVFGGTDAKDCGEKFVFGLDGKPYYCQGPAESDNKAWRIISMLTKCCGEDGFNFVLAPLQGKGSLREKVDLLLALAEQGKLVESLAGLRDLYEQHPDSASVAFGLGAWHLLDGESSAALPWFEAAVELDPELAEAWYNKGMIHKEMISDGSDPRHAGLMLKALQQAIHHWGDDENHVLGEAREIVQIFTRDAEDCGITLDAFIEACLVFAEGVALLSEEKWEAGLEKMEKTVGLNPKSHQAYGNMGLCLIQLKRIDEARGKLQTALEICPDYALAKHNIEKIEGYNDENFPADHEVVVVNSNRKDEIEWLGKGV